MLVATDEVSAFVGSPSGGGRVKVLKPNSANIIHHMHDFDLFCISYIHSHVGFILP